MISTLLSVAIIGVELSSAAAITSNAYRSVMAGDSTATHDTGKGEPTYLPTTTVGRPAHCPADQAATATVRAMQAVLPSAQVGFAVFDRACDTLLTSQDTDRQFASMSVVKLLIALDTLAGAGWVVPDTARQQELHQMLASSDDGIANKLWSTNGGPAIVTRMVDLLGLTATLPPEEPSQWGDTLITPADIVTVYRYITDQLPGPSRDLLLDALSNTPQIAADGFDQHFGIPAAMPTSAWAVKQGWGTSGSQAIMNSTGLVGTELRYVVVILAAAPASSYSTVPAAVTAGAGALADAIGESSP
ncbi:MAG: hypothetical protein ACRDSR_04575 [Pseudonocardiaceae bacterium]